MDNCNKSCSDCKSELTSMLCDVPSKWREQIVNVICNTVSNYGVCCTDVLTCINNELDTLDFSCLAESAAEWEAYSFLQKLQVIIDRICEGAGDSPDFDATSDSIIITPGGDQGHTPNFEVGISEDEDNILVFGSDNYLYVPAQNTPPLVANDSTSINFTTSGTANHTLTGVVILDPSEDNLIVNNGTGLLVDGTALEVPLTFNNGINRNVDLVQLGGNLIHDTIIGLNNIYDLTILAQNGSVSFTNSSYTHYLGSSNSSLNGSYVDQAQTTWKTQIATISDASSLSSGYYAHAIFEMSPNRAGFGFNYPTVRLGGAAPSDDPLTTSYIKATSRTLYNYANQIHFYALNAPQSTGSIINGAYYEIINNSGGASFTSSGAASNAVGTRFLSNGVSPTWGTGSLRQIGNVTSHVTGDNGNYTSFNNTDRSFDIGSYENTSDSYLAAINSAQLWEAQIRTLGANPAAYLAKGQIAINDDNFVRVGHQCPTSNDLLTPAPANDPLLTSMTNWTDATISHYAASNLFQGQMLITNLGSVGATVATAALEVRSTTKGFLPPRMTGTQKNAISSPATGLMVYQTDGTVGVYVYDGSVWRRINWT